MASLQLDNAELVRATLQVMGLDRDAGELDESTEADLRRVLRSGLNRFYHPTVGEMTYQWRFLEKHHPIPCEDSFDDGTIAVSAGTVTLTGGTWPTDLTNYFIVADGHVLFVTERTSGTLAEVSNTQVTIAAGETYDAYKYRYALPSDFGEWIGRVVYQNGTRVKRLLSSSESEIRMRYAIGTGLTGDTTHYDVTSTPDADSQTIVLFPIPEVGAFIQGVYLSIPDDNLPSDLTTPGSTVQVGPKYSEALLEAIFTAAEEYNDITGGTHAQRFEIALARAIAHDKVVGAAYDFSNEIQDTRGLGQVASEIDFWD